ncbi:MAG TPA: protein kinase [Thermoanaerobaculia bacterium]|jgi:tetratricopeptide (TPR) repeat protein|nr:protein kinase [Thermoanaerobaculia bacterium]
MSARSPFLARLAGDPLRAGDLYYQQGNLGAAAAMYRRAKRFDQAARVQLELGDRKAALELYLEAGDHLHAGELLAQDGDHREAIPHFENARAYVKAAESSLALKQHDKAARYYERGGALDRASICFEKAGELEEAMRVLEREARSLAGRIRVGGDESLKDALRQVDARRAGFLARLGRAGEAADLLLVQGDSAGAAELLEKSGEAERAVRSWVAAGQPERALPLLRAASTLPAEERARIFRSCQRYGEAAELFAEAGHDAESAECWEAAGIHEQAGPLWESAGELERAAEAFAAARRWSDAARCYRAAGKLELAAEAYVQVPDEKAAAECYLAADRPLRAARSFVAAGDRGAAAQALQTIGEESPDFQRATLLLVPLLVEEGVYAGALHRLQLLRADLSASGSVAVERYYWEARALEGEGRLADAAQAYERAVSMRRDHRDASGRLAAVRQRLQRDPTLDTGPVKLNASGQLPTRMDTPTPADATPLPELREGMVLAGRYQLLGELGRGGMGRVYKAQDRELGEVVALKTLRSNALDSTDQERLLREVQICRRITHPNVVRVYDIGRFSGGLFVTMEYLEGRTLDVELREKGPLPLARVRELLSQLLAGLEEAHQLRIVHRDLKPSNVFLTADRAKLLDFGIARQEGPDTNLTQTGEVLGSPKYMSPEQIQGEELDGRSDLYAIGVLLYVMLTGREPFVGKTPSAIALAQLRDPPPDIGKFRAQLPPEWRALLSRLLEKDRAERFASAGETRAAVLALPVE